jgi:hypothetical protein
MLKMIMATFVIGSHFAASSVSASLTSRDAHQGVEFDSGYVLAQTQGTKQRTDRRDDRQGDRKDCKKAEGIAGKDKRDCKQDERQDRNSGG